MAPRVGVSQLVLLQKDQEHIRNICILAHVDHGKTTLTDSLISSNGIISERSAGAVRYLDSRDDEQERGITMEASGISLWFKQMQMNKEFLINLIDSPGHVDFSSDVSTAVRLCDGALVIVDVVEGVGYQTHAVLRQAWEERLKPCLVLNKLDRLITELKLEPVEAYEHLQRIIERVNSIVLSYFSAAVIEEFDRKSELAISTEGDDFDESGEQALMFSPEKGNVAFASAVDSWAFRVSDFAAIVADRINQPRRRVQKCLWGNYYYSAKTNKIIEQTSVNTSTTLGASLKQYPPMFATYILDSIWQIYGATVLDSKPKRLEKIIGALNLTDKVNPKDIAKGGKIAMRTVMSTWLPLARSVMSMVVRCIPSPVVAQEKRVDILWPEEDSTTPAVSENTLAVRSAIKRCDPNGPLVLYISKMFAVPKALVPKETLQKLEAIAVEGDTVQSSDEKFFGFARIFSGTLNAGGEVYVLGPKYKPDGAHDVHCVKINSGVYPLMVMGTELVPLASTGAGNIVAIAGVESAVLKTATISSTQACASLARMPSQSAPILRVSIEPEDPLAWPALAEGLRLLNRADPVAEVRIQANGEHVLGAIGELHLERCLKDLTERFAKVPLKVSAPIAVFRESLVAVGVVTSPLAPLSKIWSLEKQFQATEDEEDLANVVPLAKRVYPSGRVCATCMDGFVKISLRAVALPDPIVRVLESNAELLSKLSGNLDSISERASKRQSAQHRLSSKQSQDDPSSANNSMHLKESLMAQELYEHLQKAFKAAGSEWDQSTLERIWRFSANGPNVLINAIQTPEENLGYIANARSEMFDYIPSLFTQDEDNLENCSPMIDSLCSGIASAFELTCKAGPLCEEPMWGVAYIIDDILVDDDNRDALQKLKARSSDSVMTGQVIPSIRDSMRYAFSLHHMQHETGVDTGYEVRLVEGFFRCSIQCHVESYEGDTLGKLYGVLSKRRGKVESEDLWEGTSIFSVDALIPIVESFSIGDEIRRKTSGAASTPQMLFSHWEMIPENPFFRATTEDELEEFGEHQYEESYMANNLAKRYIDQVRTRKGLETATKIVIAAEKQRTLKRNK